jgi:hypothetical protein
MFVDIANNLLKKMVDSQINQIIEVKLFCAVCHAAGAANVLYVAAVSGAGIGS